MAVNIKQEPLGSFPYTSVNVMDDEKSMQKSLLRKGIKVDVDPKYTKELRVDVAAANNYQNLMEYRDVPASPGASSVHSLDLEGGDNPGSPTTPSSPTPQPQEMDDERLPNELLDEICEDIGMKEGMELDFVEFLMEQDMVDPQVYMTPEAIRSTLASVATAPPSATTPLTATSVVKPPASDNSANIQTRTCGSPSTTYSVASSTNCTVATSSGSSSPVAKRFHLSTSGPSSPVRTNPPLSPGIHGGVFKTPSTPPSQRRSNVQNIASPSISSTQGPPHSPCHRPHSPTQSHSVPSSPSQKSLPPSYSQASAQKQMAPPHAIPSHMQRSGSAHNFKMLGRPAPPNVNVQNMQHQKWAGPNQQQNGMMGNQCNMGNMQTTMSYQQGQYPRSIDSPLESGYYSSGDTASVRSYGSSSVSSTIQSSVSSTNTVIPNHMYNNRQMHSPNVAPNQHQKTVHFADMPGQGPLQPGNVPMQRQASNDQIQGYPTGYENNIPDCDIENEFNQRNLPSKIMPRLNHGMKDMSAPYTVPGNNGSMSPYGDYSRNNNSRPGSGDNPAVSAMPPFDFSQKPGEMFNVDNNQNSVNIDFNGSMQQAEMHEPGYRPSCSGGAPIGMTPLRHFDGPDCVIPPQGDPIRDQMYLDGTDNYKQNMVNMGYCDGRYPQNSVVNPKMGMHPHGAPQGMMDQGQGYPGDYNCANPMQSSCGSNNLSQRGMHMQQPQMMGVHPQQGNMNANFDQNQFNNSRMQQQHSANMNNVNPMYQQTNSAGNMCQNPNGQSWAGAAPQTPQPHPGMHPKGPHPGMSGMQTPTQGGLPPGAGPMGPCTQPNCQSCKTGSPHRPPMMSSQQTFIQHIITSDRSNAFRSHPLFPLLRDLIIADMNFSSPSFPYQLISNLPADFDKLLQNFLHRNPPSGNYQGNFAVESVIMDALKYAHHCLIEKIRSRQEQDKHTKSTSKSLSAIEEFCEKFDRSVRQSIIKVRSRQEHDKHTKSTSKSLSAIEEFCEKFDRSVRQSIIKPATFQLPNQNGGVTSSTMAPGQPLGGSMTPTMGTPTKDHKFAEIDGMMMPGLFSSPSAKKGLDLGPMCSPHFKSLKDLADCSDSSSLVSSSSNHGKSESKKHPSLPKEAVAIMLDWLRTLESGSDELRQISQYYFDGQGKAFRPMVVMMMSKALNQHTSQCDRLLPSQQKVAMIAEMIHTASLIHDDVIDGATTRRGKPTVDKKWGEKKAITAGDYILSVSSIQLAQIRNKDVVQILSQVIDDLVKGEFMQLGSNEDSTNRFNHYLKKTYKKTASLIANSCKAVAVLGNCDTDIVDLAYQYGSHIGIAFQLVDDLLDFTSCDSILGKPTAADLKLGLATAPVLFAAQEYEELSPMIMRRFSYEGDVERARELVAEVSPISCVI
ncbi:hypothetical protein FSP39_019693 [Pinctada imbricata]|uniref:Uncharacterized protein n=1 Tax=Pinctada imbricata TaxID=66713 RepID=A0AA88YJI6_PINIB|nr:hypothetical protein FSP39_019693 [Pinctada imbricata]